MSMASEFKEFIMRGNVVDLAVGVIIGGAFGKIVSSLVDSIIMPIVGVLTGGINFSNLSLQIADDAPNTFDRVRPNPLGNKKGYDPYDSGKLGKPSKPQQKDLRKLGDWLKLKKQGDGKKDE